MRLIPVVLFMIYLLHAFNAQSQDLGLWSMEGSLQKNSLNPGESLKKKINIALGNYNLDLNTDGPSINSITSLNSKGSRFLDFSKFGSTFNEINNVRLESRLNSLGLSIQAGGFTWMAGHSFIISGGLTYTGALANLAARGNAPFIGQTLEIGPAFNLFAYNELYLGLQRQAGRWGLGGRIKFLFGTAGVETERNSVLFTTDQEFYQLRFQNDYLIRSSALFKINTIDDLDFSYPEFTFENLFYNNFGLAVDLGLTCQITEKTQAGISLLNLGNIKWDFFPRAFTSNGNFGFEGVDVVQYISDSTGINIADSLINLFSFSQTNQSYSTALPSMMFAGITHHLNNSWSFHALARIDQFDFKDRFSLSVGAFRNLGIARIGLNYSARKNNYALLGLNAQVNIGPLTLYVNSDHIPAWFRPLHYKTLNLGFGAGLRF